MTCTHPENASTCSMDHSLINKGQRCALLQNQGAKMEQSQNKDIQLRPQTLVVSEEDLQRKVLCYSVILDELSCHLHSMLRTSTCTPIKYFEIGLCTNTNFLQFFLPTPHLHCRHCTGTVTLISVSVRLVLSLLPLPCLILCCTIICLFGAHTRETTTLILFNFISPLSFKKLLVQMDRMVLRCKIHLTLHFLKRISQNLSIKNSYHKPIPCSTPKITWEQALNTTLVSPKVINLVCMHKVTLQHPIDTFQSTASAKQVLQRQWVYKLWQHPILVSKAAHDERIKLLRLCIIDSQHV